MKWTKTKKFLAVLLTVAMLLPAGGLIVPAAVSGGSDRASGQNLAQDKMPSVNNGNSYDVPGHFDLAYLTDGTTNRAWHSALDAEPASESNPTVLTVDLSVTHALSSISLYPYTGSAYSTSVMPRDYSVEVFSVDEGAWVTVASAKDVVLVGDDALTYEFDAIDATEVRVVITKDSAYRPGTAASCISVIGELEIIGFMAEDWTVYPTPMEATYGDQILDLSRVNLHSELAAFADRLEDKGIEISEQGVDVQAEIRTLSEFEYGAEEGYVLTINADGVKIEAQTDDGLYYGMMSLLQLINEDAICPFATIKDAPRNEWRGVIEGFYGEPWTDEFRKDLFAFMGDYKMNAYIYAPKDDAKHRDEWRTTYTTDELARLQVLVNAAKANNVKFIYAIAPGLDFSFSNYGSSSFSNEFKKLTAKCQQLYDLGVRDFAILLDDIPESKMNGANHAKLLNQFQTQFVETKGDVSPLIAVTAEYCDAFLTDGIGDGYTTNFVNAGVDEDIVLMWTGFGVSPFYNDNESLSSINSIYGREVLMWWNYPCNDYAANNLFMGANANLTSDLYESMVGLVANPMNQGYASMVPQLTIGDYLWNPEAYNGVSSLEAACKAMMPDAGEALLDFVNMTSANTVNNFTDSVELNKLLLAFKKKNTAETRDALKAYFENMVENADAILASENQKLATEIKGWLDKYRAFGEMGLLYIAMEDACAAKEGTSVVQGYVDQFNAIKASLAGNDCCVSGPIVSTPVNGSTGGDVTGKGVLTPFFEGLDDRINKMLELAASVAEPFDVARGQKAQATSSVEGSPWGVQFLLAGNKSTAGGWLDASGAISATNAPVITITLDTIYTIYNIDLYPVNAFNDAYVSVMPQEFTIELSSDGGKTWKTVATESGVISQVVGLEGHVDNGGLPAINDPYSIELAEPTAANMMRMTITKGGTGRSSNTALPDPTYGGTYAPYTSIGSIEMIGVAGVAEEVEPTNVALGQTLTIEGSGCLSFSPWTADTLLDGIKATEAKTNNGAFLTPANRATAANPVNLVVRLDGTYKISTLKVFRGHADETTYMPKAYNLDVSEDGVKWKTVATATAPQSVDDAVFTLAEPVVAKYVRMQITQDSGVDLTAAGYGWSTVIGELEAWGVPYVDEDAPELSNVAMGSNVTIPAGQFINNGSNWTAAGLVDGVKNSGGVLLAPGGSYTNPITSPIDITLKLDGRYTIYSVDLYDAYGGFAMPQGYIISVSDDGTNFTPVATVTNGEQRTTMHAIVFETPATGSYIRLTITNGCNIDWGGGAFCAVGELEAWGVPYVGEDGGESEPEIPNIAAGKTVSVSGTTYIINNTDWNPSMLVDGIKSSESGTNNGIFLYPTSNINASAPVDIVVKLNGTYEISSLAIFKAHVDGNATMPVAYTLDVSEDGTIWKTVATETAGNPADGDKTFTLTAPVVAKYVRIHITQGSGWDLSAYGLGFSTAIGELEVYGVPYTPGAEPKPDPVPVNVASGKNVLVTDDNTMNVPEAGWDLSYLTDGSADTAWHSLSGSSATEPTVITLDLGGVCDVSSVNLLSYAGSFYDTSVMPRDYRVEVLSPEHEGWVVLGTETDMAAVNGEGKTYAAAASVKATEVRIVITKDSATNVSVIGELEVWGTPYTGEVSTNHTAESTYDPATGIRTYGACSICGKDFASTFTTVWSRDVRVKVDESLKMYFYAWVDESVVDPTLRVTRNGKDYTVAGTVVSTVGDAVEYEFAFTGVTPQYADAELTAELWCDGYKLLTKNCSLQQYIDDRKDDATIDQAESDMLAALDTYFAALENVQEGANNEVNVDDFTEVVTTDKKVKNNGDFATFKSATVGCGNDVRIRYILTLADGVSAADLTFKIKVNGGTETEVAADLIKFSGSTVMIFTDAIAITNLDDVYTVTVYNGDTAGASFAYSVKSYVYSFQSATGDSEDQVELVKALYNYGLSAKAYADAQ